MTFHEKILKKLIEYRESHPDFRFVTRQRNNNNRLENGYWFQGEDYAFVGLFDRSGGVNKTRSFGLVFWQKSETKFGCFVELVYKGEKNQKVIKTYEKLRSLFGPFKEVSEQKYQKYLTDTDENFESVFEFLDSFYPQLLKFVSDENQNELIISETKFNNLLSKVNSIRNKLNYNNVNKLLVNITWNSKDWKEESEDTSNHRWVKEGGTPGESLNFAKDADGNTEEHIFGYAKFTHEPKIEGSSIFIFYSQGKIVGFYGNAELIHKKIENDIILNLKGEQNLSFVLENKIDNAKELGFLEGKERVGMINFNYIEHDKTVISILNKALELNPTQEEEILRLKKWFIEKTKYVEKDVTYWIFQGNPKIYNAVAALNSNAIKTWTVSAHKDKIKKGDKFILWQTGANAGCYALGTIGAEVTLMKEKDDEMAYYLAPTPQIENYRVKVIIDHSFANNPVYWESIKNNEIFKDFKAGNQGTNFTASKAEYDYFNSNTNFTTQTKDTMSATNLNQILFGPPGTGKTFNTINEALKIVDPSYFEEHQNDRKKLTDRFKELLIKNSDENKGQISFCTFHQSFSYEDFVEGIKPKTTDTKNVIYDIESGVFKNICQLADSYNSTIKIKNEGKISWTDDQFNKASFYKLSLGEYNNPNDRAIYEFCRDNSYIALGFGEDFDFSGLSETEIVEKCQELNYEGISAQQLNYFIHYLKKNNYVLISNGNKYIRAIGKVVGDYEYIEDSPIRYNQFRKVEWLFVDELIPIEEIYERGLSQKTMYKIDETALKKDFFTNRGQTNVIESKETKKFVIVIDEINRGNVSAIFGELITLIEKDKRAGCDEELEVTLPYSKEPFKVPNNVYLIGTMNTADRSIEALDTALRRRFSFKEFSPKPYLIKTEGASSKNNGMVDGIDLESLLNTINTRIEKLIDKDHKIGHSYFLKVDNKEKLVHAFKNEIIPLLEEYFFGDYGKIGLVLGSSFIEKVNHDFDFATFEHYDNDIQSDLKEKAVFRIKNEDQWDFNTI